MIYPSSSSREKLTRLAGSEPVAVARLSYLQSNPSLTLVTQRQSINI